MTQNGAFDASIESMMVNKSEYSIFSNLSTIHKGVCTFKYFHFMLLYTSTSLLGRNFLFNNCSFYSKSEILK